LRLWRYFFYSPNGWDREAAPPPKSPSKIRSQIFDIGRCSLLNLDPTSFRFCSLALQALISSIG